MTSQHLPERPNLEQLKNQAKSLLRAAREKEAEALERFRRLPAFAERTQGELARLDLALHDAQSVIAREHGFDSWRALRERVEELTLDFDGAADEFVRCATADAQDRAQRMLDLHPSLARARLWIELLRADVDAVVARLDARPELAKERVGPLNWSPLAYLCHSSLKSLGDARRRIAEKLLDLGADPNDEYHFQWHHELPRTLLWAAFFVVRDRALAEMLLRRGARATDGVTLQIAAGAGDLETLELLARHGVDPNGLAGGLPALAYSLTWGDDQRGARWLLEHGADPNLAWSETSEAPLHVAARRWPVELVELLVSRGAKLDARTRDGATPHQLAALNGNVAVAAWLLAHGARDELTALQRFVAACASGDREGAAQLASRRPSVVGELTHEHHLLLEGAAERGDVRALEALLANGFDPSVKDREGVTPLHRAAMAGHVEATRMLLKYRAPVDALDGMFSANALLWAAHGWSESGRESRHVRVARLLLDAGAEVVWAPPQGAPSIEGTLDGLTELCRAAQSLPRGE